MALEGRLWVIPTLYLFQIAYEPALVDVSVMSDDNLTWLSRWYLAQCDHEWEHTYGIKIDTLDNPGWSLEVDLTGTLMSERTFEHVEHGENSSNLEQCRKAGSWWVAYLDDERFVAACGPLDLVATVGVFRRWVEASP